MPVDPAYANKQARIKTRLGEMVLKFFPEVAPGHVKNFIDLANKGFYNKVIFHRVIKDFMIQGGCPEGTGRGGPGYTIKDEVKGNDKKHFKGALSMAKTAAPNTAGSQFFIMHGKHAKHLDGVHTVFGELIQGMDVLDKIASVKTGPGDRPVEPVAMESVTIEDAS
jgi:peptidyl-prolyl cis-trans isomerase B (cyclophilin B)